MSITLLVIVIIVALIFAITNGFHDAATAIATMVSTKTLSPRVAVIYGGLLNFAGAFFGIQVAKTIGVGLVDIANISQLVILCALIAAIAWNLITWHLSLPSSSSHALIGGLLGAAIAKAGWGTANIHGILHKVLIPMVLSPIIGALLSIILTLILIRICFNMMPHKVNKRLSVLQIISSGLMAFSHGANDTQKTMGMITIALVTYYSLQNFQVPLWVTILAAAAMALGTLVGGWRIIRTMGKKIARLRPLHGFASQTSSAIVLLLGTHWGIPLSTTHVVSGSVMGVGATHNSSLNWRMISNMVYAWIFTVPASMIIAAILFSIAYHL